MIQRTRGERLEKATSFKTARHELLGVIAFIKKHVFGKKLGYIRKKRIQTKDLAALETQMHHVLTKLRHIPGWLPEWERLSHDADDGFCGTLDNPSAKKVGAVTKYAINLSGLPEKQFDGFELGNGVLDTQKRIHICLPQVDIFGYDLKNYFEGVFSNLRPLAKAVRNLNAKISTYYGIKLKDVGRFEYAYGYSLNKVEKLEYFFIRIGAPEHMAKSKNKIVFAFWEGWKPEHKRIMLKSISKSSVRLFFCGDRQRNIDTDEKLALLNSTNRQWINEFVVFTTTSVRLAHGGDTMSGVFFIRRNIIVKHFSLKSIPRAPPPPPADLTKVRWMILFEKSESISLSITRNAVAYHLVERGLFCFSGYPNIFNVCNYVDHMEVEELLGFCEMAVKKYLTSPWYISGGYYHNNRQLRSFTSSMTRSQRAAYALKQAKINMLPINYVGIVKEFSTHAKRCELFLKTRQQYATIISSTKLFGCKQCDFIATKEEVFAHALGQECEGDEDDICDVVDDIDSFVFQDNDNPMLTNMCKEYILEHEKDFACAGAVEKIERKLISRIEKTISTYNEDNREKELINRYRAHVTVRQQNVLNRTKKHLVNWRFVDDHWIIPIGDKVHKIKIKNLTTRLDSETAREMLRKSHLRDFVGTLPIKQDNAYVRDVLKLVKYRLTMVMKHKMRKKRWLQHDALYISLHVDGAPRCKSGDQPNQLSVVIRILNENLSACQSQLIPLVIANVAEDSPEAKKICQEVAIGLQELITEVEGNGLPEIGGGPQEVKIIAGSDLKALNKLFGFVGHTSVFCHPSKIYACKENSGYGSTSGRTSKTPFVEFEGVDMSVDDFMKIHKGRIDAMDAHLKTIARIGKRKRKQTFTELIKLMKNVPFASGDLPTPVNMTGDILKFLRSEILKTPKEDRAAMAKKMGIGLVDPDPLFGSITWYCIALCALHYKTTKILDLLNLSCITLASYDEIRGHVIADEGKLGPSLRKFLDSLPSLSSKLCYYCEKQELLYLKTANKCNFAQLSSSKKHLEAYLDKGTTFSQRLIGEQANIVMRKTEEILESLAASRGAWGGKSSKKNEEGFDTIISGIYLMVSYTRDLVYYMSLSSHPDDENSSDRKIRLEEIYKKYLFTAKKLEYLQCFVFPDLYRPYDLTATCVGPDIFKKLVETGDGFLMGEAGLLQALEQYHQYIRGMPVFKCYRENGFNDGACLAKLLKILLIHIYGNIIDPLPITKKVKQYTHPRSGEATRTSVASSIKTIHEHDRGGCVCGRKADCSICSICNKYKQIEPLDNLVAECADLLISPQSVSQTKVNAIHKKRKKLTKNVWITGTKV